MTMPSRVTNHTLTPIDHMLINLPNKACHSNVKDFGLSDHNLIYRTRKHTYPNTASIMKYSAGQRKKAPPNSF